MENYLCICSGWARCCTLRTAPFTDLATSTVGQASAPRPALNAGPSLQRRRYSARSMSTHRRADCHPSRGLSRRALPLVALTTTILFGAGPGSAIGPNDRRMTNVRFGISVEAPAGWTLSQHTGYTDTVVLFIHPDGSRIAVTAAATTARDANALYEENRPGLVAQGLAPTPVGSGVRGSWAVDLDATGRSDKMRQLYLVRDVPLGRQAIIFTLVSAGKVFPARLLALDFVATHLTLDDPVSGANRGRPVGSTGRGGAGGR